MTQLIKMLEIIQFLAVPALFYTKDTNCVTLSLIDIKEFYSRLIKFYMVKFQHENAKNIFLMSYN